MKLSKKQQTKLREQHILLVARKAVAGHGLIGLKMPQLAKDSNISIGTLYRHFQSREDLIAALAQYALEARFSKLLIALSLFECPTQKLISVALLDFIFNIKHSEAFHVETSCTHSNMKHLASDLRQHTLKVQGEKLTALLTQTITQACPNNNAQQTTIGLWGLVSGLSSVWHSTMSHSNLEQALHFYRPQLVNFFSGNLPKLLILDKDITLVEKQLLEHSESWTWKMEIDISEDN